MWSRMPEPATVWWVGRTCQSPQLCGLVVTRLGPSVIRWWCFGIRMCRGTRLLEVFGAVWAVANSCQVVVGRWMHTRVCAAVAAGVSLGCWPYVLGIQPPGGLVDMQAKGHDHWASWWRFSQAETRSRWVVVGQWLRVWVRTATGRGCGWWLAARTGVLL